MGHGEISTFNAITNHKRDGMRNEEYQEILVYINWFS